MEGIKCVNLIEISPVVIELRGAENGELAVPVNNTLVSHTAFLAADTRPCVLKYGNFQEHISRELLDRFLLNLVCRVAYMEGIKCVNLIEISPVVIEIRGAENGELAVPVNNTLVSHTAFLAADTRPCVLIYIYVIVK